MEISYIRNIVVCFFNSCKRYVVFICVKIYHIMAVL